MAEFVEGTASRYSTRAHRIRKKSRQLSSATWIPCNPNAADSTA